MYWRAEKALIEYTAKTFRRIFEYAPNFINKTLEIVQFASGSKTGDLIFEQYNEEAEKYPRITVGGTGGRYEQLAFNDLFNTFDNDFYVLGSRILKQVYVSGNSTLAFPLPSDMSGETLRGLFTTLAWTGLDFGNNPLQFYLYSDYTTTPNLVASGSYGSNITFTNLRQMYASLYPLTTLTGSDYWIEFQAPTGSSYYVGIDPTFNSNYSLRGNLASGSIVGKLLLPGFIRIGGGFDGMLQLKCEAKNDSNLPRNLAEIVAQYFGYLKHTQVKRSNSNVMALTDDKTILIDEWLSKGVRIKTISEGPLLMRPRGDSDKIFGVAVSINYFTEWFEDFPLDSLDNINITIETFWNNVITNLTI